MPAQTRRQLAAHPARYRRSPGLVIHWAGSELVCTDCVSGRRFAVSPEALSVLVRLDGGTSAAAIAAAHPEIGGLAAIDDLLAQLVRAKVIAPGVNGAWPWTTWMPEAAFFHFGTKATRFPADPRQHDRELRAKAVDSPPPAPVKAIAGRATTLPAAGDLGGLTRVLRERRTWRNFSAAKVGLPEMATLLQTTFGVQRWGTVKGQGRVVLKTSPSAGARHPIEAYLLAANVKGLSAGIYHYDSARHRLVALKRKMSKGLLVRVLANQQYFADAAAIVIMSAVFARSMWKYPSSRAYRAILIDAGHLGQTFCLAATALGLAPFSTMAFREHEVDSVLGIDGVSEGAMYVVGVGTRAAGHEGRPGRIATRGTT